MARTPDRDEYIIKRLILLSMISDSLTGSHLHRLIEKALSGKKANTTESHGLLRRLRLPSKNRPTTTA